MPPPIAVASNNTMYGITFVSSPVGTPALADITCMLLVIISPTIMMVKAFLINLYHSFIYGHYIILDKKYLVNSTTLAL